jgi:hypothetical protein
MTTTTVTMATTTSDSTTSSTELLFSAPSTRAELARQAAYQLLSPQNQQQQQRPHEEMRSNLDTPTTIKSSLPSPNPLPFLPILASIWFLASPSGPALWTAALVDFFRVAAVTGVICGLDWYARGVLRGALDGQRVEAGELRSEVRSDAGEEGSGEQVVKTFVLVGFVVVLSEVMSLGGG